MTQLLLTSGDLYAPPHLLWKAGLHPPGGAGGAYTGDGNGEHRKQGWPSRSQNHLSL